MKNFFMMLVIFTGHNQRSLKFKDTTNKALGYFKDNMSVQDINNHSDWKSR